MLEQARNTNLYSEWLAYIESEETKSVVPAAGNAVVTIKQGAVNVWQDAYRKSIDFSQSFGK